MTETQKPRVLFVDDEPRILSTMRMLFKANYELYFAESGAKALEMLKTQAVDVIVSDQRMPGMTGIELLRQARELNPNAMRILLTGYSDLNAIIGSVNDGEIFRFVNKPWNNEELSNTVAKAVVAAKGSAAATAKGGDAVVAGPVTGTGVLVLDEDPSVPPQIQQIVGPENKVYGTTTMEQAVDVLEKEKIGVVISETRVQDNPVINLISTLKQHRPELVSVILTDHADAGAAIGLINQGQIYRYIVKPVQSTQAKIAVNSAMKQHQRLAQNPDLTQRYEVQAPPAAAAPQPGSANAGMIDRIKALRWGKKPA
ncbi:MAG TPA: response regulator [Nevskiaceae bacterium]|nr:response regulator [Nevskiaceae bacterium]